jgi:hypothetical protein
MGLFDIFRKKKPSPLPTQENKEVIPAKANNIETTIPTTLHEIKKTDPVKTNVEIPLFKIHDDIKGLIWIGDGKYKNYTPENKYGFTAEFEDVKIAFSCNYGNEPSIIYTQQPQTSR